MPRTLLALALLALAVSACGSTTSNSSSKFKGAQGAVAKVVDDLAAAGKSKDPQRICSDILSKTLVTELKTAGGDCVDEMRKAIDDADDFDLQVRSVTVNGNQARARVRQGKDGPLATFTFVRESGGWRATSLGRAS